MNFVLTLVLPSIIYLALGVMVNKLRIGSNDGKKNNLYVYMCQGRSPAGNLPFANYSNGALGLAVAPVFLRDLP